LLILSPFFSQPDAHRSPDKDHRKPIYFDFGYTSGYFYTMQNETQHSDGYSMTEYTSGNDLQAKLITEFVRLRNLFGPPHRFAYLRSRARTRKYTRTVYPPGWRSR